MPGFEHHVSVPFSRAVPLFRDAVPYRARIQQRCADPEIFGPRLTADVDQRSASASVSAGRCCVTEPGPSRQRLSSRDLCERERTGLRAARASASVFVRSSKRRVW